MVRTPKVRRIWLLLAVLTAVTGPFGSYEVMPLAVRLVYWPLVVGAAIGLGSAVRIVVRTRLGLTDFWHATAAVAILNVLVFTPLLVVLSPLAGNASLPSALEFASFVLASSLGLSAVRLTLGIDGPSVAGQREDPVQQPSEPSDASAPRLLDRLPEAERDDLIRISGRNHHVEIHTRRGASKVLLRFADAVAETAPVAGLQVHRSHWVSLASVTGVERRSGKTVLLLCDGSEVPVSRNYRAALEAVRIG